MSEKKLIKVIEKLYQVTLNKIRHIGTYVSPLIAKLPSWKEPKVKIGTLVISVLIVGVYVGRLTVDPNPVSAVKKEKNIEVEKSGAISISLPGVQLDPDMFKFEKLEMDKVPLEINVPGKLAFNAEKTKVIAARVAGRIEKVFTFDGAVVKAGQAVAEYYSPDFISAQQEFLLSNQTLKLFNSGTYRDLIEDAKNTVDASANRLRVLGAANEEIEQLKRGIPPRSTMMIRAPIAGVVIKRNQDPGAYMNVGDILATIADPGALWFLGNIFEQDIPKISKGQILKLKSESYPDKEFEAVANYVSPAIDPVTHALVIRCDVNNKDGLLRPEMFVNAKLQTSKVDAIVVPESAIIKIRNTKYVILKGDKDVYRRVPVTGFDMADKKFAITDGLSSDAEVLVFGASLMNERFTNQEE